ncbi:MAG: ABC transporter permease [Gammaproteobacteria bacterium]|nr:ABC transporter permease [Gammaproteobacteria bacterium]
MPTPLLLLSDFAAWLLFLVALAYAFTASRREHLRAPWRRVRQQPVAMVAAVILLAHVGITLLDSLHFAPQAANGTEAEPEPLSALDFMLTPLRTGVETSYSAPFALLGFDRESVLQGNGRAVREYPRLRYGGAHLRDPAQWGLDMLQRGAIGAGAGALAGVLLLRLLWSAQCRPWRRCDEDPAGRAAALTLLLLCVLAGLGGALATRYHVFGTDKVGMDVLYQSVKSVRTGLLIGTLTTLVTLPFALVLGVAAGYYRGRVDDLVQYGYTTLASIPGVLLVAASALLLDGLMTRHQDAFSSLIVRADLRLLALCVILGITSWTGLCRLLRAEALKLRESDFVRAAEALGVRGPRILWRHLLPNVMHIVIIATVLDFSGLVLAEAALTYINIGVDPGMESWGNMINAARMELARQPAVWWCLSAAMLWMFVLVLAANLFADAVREAFDPRTREATPSARPAGT